MKEHDDDVKSINTVERDEDEDMLVDFVGADDVNSDVYVPSNEFVVKETESSDRDMVTEEVAGLASEKDEVTVHEDVAGSGGEYDVLDGSRGLACERVEVIVNEEGFKTSAEISKDVLREIGVNGDVAAIDSKEVMAGGSNEEVVELCVESVEEVSNGKIPESSFKTVNLGSEKVEMVVAEEGIAEDNQSSATEVIDTGIGEADDMGKDERLHLIIEVTKDDAQGDDNVESLSTEPMVSDKEVTEGDGVINETIVKENEALNSSKISEPSSAMNPGSEDIDVVVADKGLTSKDEAQDDAPVDRLVSPDYGSLSTEVVSSTRVEGDDLNVLTENLDEREVDKMSKQVSFDSNDVAEKAENGTGSSDSKLVVESSSEAKTGEATDAIEEETERGLTKNEVIIEHPTESIQEVAYGNGIMDDETGKGDKVLDSSSIPESLTTVDFGPEEVNGVTPVSDVVEHPEFSFEDVDMEGGEDAGMDIVEVLGWKDEIPRIDVLSGAGKDEDFNAAANSEAEQGLPKSSTLEASGKDEPVLIRHREENNKSREPIVYGRRANVEVPLYDALDESRSLVLEDENLEIETDSEEYDEYMQEEEENVVGQSTDLLENGSSLSLHQSRYFRPPRNDGEFAVSDLVWGKVRSHPWWPGQIIDPSHASQKAMKYHKKDFYLVAYFGDHSFAWNDSSVLKPFRANFSQIEKQSNLEAFKIAVECSLEEVTRRVEFGLTCCCVPRDIYKKIEYQVIESGGVRQKSAKRHGSDESASVSSFEPDKLVDFVRLLAQFPDEGDQMDLVMAKAQLSSYSRYKGHRDLPEFQFFGDMLEEDAPIHEGFEPANKNGEKFENNLIESAYPNKEISLSDITDDAPESGGGASRSVSSSGLKKRKGRKSISNGSVKRQNRQPDKVSTPLVSTPKPSFKIGELIQRAASQLTGPPSALKSNSDTKVDNGQHAEQVAGSAVSWQTSENPEMEASVAEVLSQLHSIAQDPMKDYTFLRTTIPFFYNRRADVYSKFLKKSSPIERPANDEKTRESNEIYPEEFDFDFQFDDLSNDSYWTDKIIQNPSDEPLLQEQQNGGIDYQVLAYEQEKLAKRRCQSNKKHVSRTKRVKVEVKEEEPEIVRRRRENLATEVVLNLAEGSSFPSVVNLNKIFRRFGPLMDSETEVDSQGGRARVVFKKCSDAEVAHSSAGKFKIFGSTDVKYELNYTPLVSYKPLPLPLLHDPMDAN